MTILLDGPSRRAAKALAARLGISPSEAIRRALLHDKEHVLDASTDVRRRRVLALARLTALFEGHDAASEIRRLKQQDALF